VATSPPPQPALSKLIRNCVEAIRSGNAKSDFDAVLTQDKRVRSVGDKEEQAVFYRCMEDSGYKLVQ
jgi:hypothetical protein